MNKNSFIPIPLVFTSFWSDFLTIDKNFDEIEQILRELSYKTYGSTQHKSHLQVSEKKAQDNRIHGVVVSECFLIN